jgi:single-stranded DNA-binding protein
VFISGELSTREYEKDGQARTALSLNVQSLAFGASSRNAEDKTLSNSTELNDEIPF